MHKAMCVLCWTGECPRWYALQHLLVLHLPLLLSFRERNSRECLCAIDQISGHLLRRMPQLLLGLLG